MVPTPFFYLCKYLFCKWNIFYIYSIYSNLSSFLLILWCKCQNFLLLSILGSTEAYQDTGKFSDKRFWFVNLRLQIPYVARFEVPAGDSEALLCGISAPQQSLQPWLAPQTGVCAYSDDSYHNDNNKRKGREINKKHFKDATT